MADIAQLSQEIAKERGRVMGECAQKVQDVLKEYGCGLVAIPQIQDGKIVAVVQIVTAQ